MGAFNLGCPDYCQKARILTSECMKWGNVQIVVFPALHRWMRTAKLLCSAQRMIVEAEGRLGQNVRSAKVPWKITYHVAHVGQGPISEPTSFRKESCGKAIQGVIFWFRIIIAKATWKTSAHWRGHSQSRRRRLLSPTSSLPSPRSSQPFRSQFWPCGY